MPDVELSAGTLDYADTGGDGPVLVLLSGLFIGGSLWRHVVGQLRGELRCVVPELPLGAHHRPMRAGADLSGSGLARLVAEFLDRLDVSDVTLVGCDWGGAQLLVAQRLYQRVGRLVLLPQEAFDNFPPGLPGRFAYLSAKLPGFGASLQPLRWRPIRRLPMTFGRMSKRPVPAEVMDEWLRPALTQQGIRRDVVAYLRSTAKGEYVEAARRLGDFDRPALVIWATEDRVMPPAHGRRLADCLPDARLVEIPDSYTLVPEDQPVACAEAIRAFVRETAGG
jgi:pimeloyl-ACP methyl ester carboxylesterase